MTAGFIIPYRKRADHLKISAPVLSRHGKVYVIEQMDKKSFNRAKLINIGYLEFKNEFDYFIAHDVDLIPEKVNYSESVYPCHLATQAEQYNYTMPYPEYFGGVTIFPKDKFEKVNGFSNEFWGWGGEDDFIRKRFLEMSIPLSSRECRFRSLYHIRNINQKERIKNRRILFDQMKWEDGLISCKYEIVHCEDREHYTICQVTL